LASGEKTTEDQLAEIEQLMNLSHFYPTADPWGQKIGTLDVHIPHEVSINPFKSHSEPWSTRWSKHQENFFDSLKSAASMYTLATEDAFPGIHLPRAKWRTKLFSWPFLAFKCQSLKQDAWMSGVRVQALEAYKAVNKAVSLQDEKTIKRLTQSTYQDTLLKLLRRRDMNSIHYWRLLNEGPIFPPTPTVKWWKFWQSDKAISGAAVPVKVLSIRATEGYLGKDDPKLGNRMLVHVLIKFDTKQSLQIHSKKGELLNPGQGAKRVVEYLVLEKRMWYDAPWTIREQIFV